MRTQIVLLVSALTLTHAFAVNAADIFLKDAIRTGKVECTVTGLGGSTGDSMLLHVQKKVPEPLDLHFLAGTIFQSH